MKEGVSAAGEENDDEDPLSRSLQTGVWRGGTSTFPPFHIAANAKKGAGCPLP
jgi:hypothetical protein